MMDQLVKSPDFTWAMSKVFIWSCCEPFVGIVCACLPTYAPLVRTLWRRAGSSYERYGSEKDRTAHLTSARGLNKKRMGVLTTITTLNRERDLDLEGGHTYKTDDEIELTGGTGAISASKLTAPDDVMHPPTSSSASSATAKTSTADQPAVMFSRNEIMVRKDFSWESTS